MYPDIITKLIEDFKKLPGIGSKTAERMALFVATTLSESEVKGFAEHLMTTHQKLSFCSVCGLLTEQNPCKICTNELRDDSLIMVVAESRDAYLIEKTKSFLGKYHVLGGVIDFSRGITENDLNFELLNKRLDGVKELIIATNSTVEGEMTAQYLKNIIRPKEIKITRLASGIPAGSDFKYADQETLSQAILNRRSF